LKLGIFESIFTEESVAEKFDALTGLGFNAVQFDLKSARLAATLPREIPDSAIHDIRSASKQFNVEIAALAGTFNMIDPNVEVRQANLALLIQLIEHAGRLGSGVVTVCTGTRDPDNMWEHHPDNQSNAAWSDLIATLTPAVKAAEAKGVKLGVEPEPGNVVNSPTRARRLLDEIGSNNLGIIADPANILVGDRNRPPETVLDDAFALLGDRIVLAHAKDLDGNGQFAAVGTGIVPWNRFADLLRQSSYNGAVVCHSLGTDDIDLAKSVLADAGVPA
jgi:sugar phosphate isomerase/epimerase